jgi:hypothetical protein
VPAKLRATFDYFGAAPYYLHEANAERFSYRAKVMLGALETLVSRLALAAALVSVLKLAVRMRAGPGRTVSLSLSVLGLAACVLVPGAYGYLACAAAVVALGASTVFRLPTIVGATAATIGATALTHAVFFGAGRYGLVVVPFVTALGFVRLPAPTAIATEGPRWA